MDEAPVVLRGLPAAGVASLRALFAEEVAERLPRMVAALLLRDAGSLDVALRDAHTLGSSTVVLGEPEASRSARRIEALLVRWQDEPSCHLLDEASAELDRLRWLLAGWGAEPPLPTT